MYRMGRLVYRAARVAWVAGEEVMEWLTDGFLCGFFGMLFVGLPYLIGSGEF